MKTKEIKIKFYLNHPSKKGKSNIECYLMNFNKIFTLNTGISIHPEYWDKENHRANLASAKRNNILKGRLKKINNALEAFENKIRNIELDVKIKIPNAGFDEKINAIKRYFNKKELFEIYDEFLADKKHDVSKATNYKYLRLKSLLQEYESYSDVQLNLHSISKKNFFHDFFSYLISKPERPQLNNSAMKNCKFLKTFLGWAYDKEYLENKHYERIKRKDLIKDSHQENDVIFLNYDEVMLLYNLTREDLAKDEENLKRPGAGNKKISPDALLRVRDIFVFQIMTGQRYSDIQQIEWNDISNASWKVRTQKTKQNLIIPLNSLALSIISKYKDFQRPLPVVSNQRANEFLKILLKAAGINDPVKIVKFRGNERFEETYPKWKVCGTHTARRSCVSVLSELRVSEDVIRSLTGHQTVEMMRKYLGVTFDRQRKELDKAWGSNLKLL